MICYIKANLKLDIKESLLTQNKSKLRIQVVETYLIFQVYDIWISVLLPTNCWQISKYISKVSSRCHRRLLIISNSYVHAVHAGNTLSFPWTLDRIGVDLEQCSSVTYLCTRRIITLVKPFLHEFRYVQFSIQHLHIISLNNSYAETSSREYIPNSFVTTQYMCLVSCFQKHLQ